MSVLELKGGIMELVSRLEDEQALAKLYKYAAKAVSETSMDTDWWDELSPAQQQELTLAVEESYDDANLISHEVAMKKLSKWRK